MFKINKNKIGDNQSTYIIAEIGSNHNQNIDTALLMIENAAICGANAVKFQSLKFDELYNPNLESDKFKNWFQNIELEEKWYPKLIEKSKSCGVDFLSSPTYDKALSILNKLDVKAFKIASPQSFGNKSLLRKAAKIKKPLIISLGYSDYKDIQSILKICKEEQNNKIIFLHCVSKYPCQPIEMKLNFIKTLKKITEFPVGFSDHSIGSTMSIVAVSLGACVLEKHVTLDSNMKGPDHHFAMNFREFKEYVKHIRDAEQSLKFSDRYNLLPEEIELRKKVTLKAISKKIINKGEKLSDKNIIFLRATQEGINIEELGNLNLVIINNATGAKT